MRESNLTQILDRSAASQVPTGEVKAWYEGRRQDIIREIRAARPGDPDAEPVSGRAIAARFSAVMDELIAALEPGAEGYAVVAVGGYGAGLLAPHSDVDLMVLHDGTAQAAAEERATRLFHTLWDCGIELGHSVRSLEDCREKISEDVIIATTLTQSRRVSGDERVIARLASEVIAPYFVQEGPAYIRAKLDETTRRHAHYGDSFCMMEPNVKETKGGLRDFMTALWLARASDGLDSFKAIRDSALFPIAEQDRAREAEDQLWLVRSLLHALHDQKTDRLDVAAQGELAKQLGYTDSPEADAVERFMKAHYLGAKAIYRFLRHWLGRCRAAARPSDHLPLNRSLSDALVLRGDTLYPQEGAFPGPDPVRGLMQPFTVAVAEGCHISDALGREIRARLDRVDDAFRASPIASDMFLALLSQPTGVARALKQMHWTGLLGRYLPEFGELDCLVNLKVYHDYTVDEHTLMALGWIDHLAVSEAAADAFKRSVLERLDAPWLLRLAILLHDAGKSRGPGHEERGAVMATSLAVRLGLAETDAYRLRALVLHHLLMARTAGMRDFSDPVIVDQFVQTVGDLETLDMLYLLSYADVSAVGRGGWPAWQDAVVTEFYRLCRAAIEQPDHPREQAVTVRERLLAPLADPTERAAAEEHLAGMLDSYVYELEPDELSEHLRLIGRLGGADSAVFFTQTDETYQIWIATLDRPSRFAQLAGCLTLLGFTIVQARAHTRRDGVVLDRFVAVVPDPNGDPLPTQAALEERLSGRTGADRPLADLIARFVRRVRPDVSPAGQVNPQVRIDNHLSVGFTVIDVIATDRIALLYRLSECLGQHRLEIVTARVATKGNVATDVFYITRQNGKKLTDPERLSTVKAALLAIAGER